MQNDIFLFPESIYAEHLTVIEGIHFTRREIDVMACLLHLRGTSKIASLLSISTNTALVHTRNLMGKLECTSREGVVDFIENSHKLPLIKRHYAGLVVFAAFEKALNTISKLKKRESPVCSIFYVQNKIQDKIFIDYLQIYLKRAGINAEIRQLKENDRKEDIKSTKPLLLLFSLSKEGQEISQLYPGFESIDLRERKNDYFSILDILKKLLSAIDLDPVVSRFNQIYEAMEQSLQSSGRQDNLTQNKGEPKLSEPITLLKKIEVLVKEKRAYFIVGFFLILLFGAGLWMQGGQYIQARTTHSIRSDLILPTESLLLNRLELITQLEEKFKAKGEEGIQTVALVGMGGVGKTTLARQYALTQNASLIWQIKAETHESLKNSFEGLAYALAHTEEDKKNLRNLQDIQDLKEKEEKILLFVKERMKTYPHWLLIYDNVNKFEDIQNYFPQDPHSWGLGKIILTTRNMNIQNNAHVNHVISMGEINPTQKLALFMNILTHGNKTSLPPLSRKDAENFLTKIPLFPLDTALAAYYLKATNVSYEQYLERLQERDQDFEDVEENLLKESGDYTKTRYQIIALSLKELMDINPDFGDLLLFMSLLASHPIPRDLLDSYKNAGVVDKFIYNLKKYSLITDENPSSPVGPTLSMHQSLQGVGLAYLVKSLNFHKNKQLIQTISTTLENYMADAIDKDDLDRMKLLITHCEWFLKHPRLLDDNEKEAIGGELGGLYFYVKNYPKARQVLEESLHKGNAKLHTVSTFVYLSLVYMDLAEYEKAKTLLEKSLVYYQQHDPKNHLRVAQIIGYLGSLEGDKGHYEVSRDLFEQSLALYKQDTTQAPLQRARVLTSLANVYREFAEYEKAKELLEESTLIYKKYYPENHVRTAWALALLGNVNRSLGQYDKAKDLLEESLAMYKKNYPDHHVSIAWISTHLGNTYRKLGQYDKAKDLLEKSYFIYTNYFSDNHVAGAWVLTHLGNLYKELGDDVKAKEALEKGYRIYKAHNLGTLWSSAQLGNFYREQGQLEKARELINKSYATYQEHPAERDVRLAMLLRYLGNLSRDSGDYEKAKELLKTSQALYAEICGESHIETARNIHDLGKIYLLEGDLKEAGLLLQNALTGMEQTQHPDVYRVLETLAELELKKAALEESTGNTSQTQTHKAQAVFYLNKALEVAKTHLPEDSSHIKWIHAKMKKFE